jgi:cell division protein FtsB
MFNWNLIYRTTCGLLILVLLVAGALTFMPKIKTLRTVQAEKAKEEDLERQERELLQALKEKQDRFARDPRFVQQIAHDMGMAKPGEVLFKFQDTTNVPLILPGRP